MSQEKRPLPPAAAAPAVIVEKYDPRQAPSPTSPAAQSSASTGQPSAPQLTTVQPAAAQPGRPVEIGGPSGPEPTRYGDWERNGRVSDF